MGQELNDSLCLGLTGIFGNSLGIQRGGIDIETAAGTHQITHDQSHEQCDGGDYFEV